MTYAGILIISLQMQKKIEADIMCFAPSHACSQWWGRKTAEQYTNFPIKASEVPT